MSPAEPARPRKTRRERQDQTRDRVVSAAETLFYSLGYHQTTLSAIADAAGFTKGAVYSNFAGKADVALAVINAAERHRFTELGRDLLGTDPATRYAELFEEWEHCLLDALPLIRLRSELEQVAAEDRELAAAIGEQMASLRTVVVDTVRRAGDPAGLPLGLEHTVDVLLALSRGMAIRKLADSSFDLHVFADAAMLLAGVSLPSDPTHA